MKRSGKLTLTAVPTLNNQDILTNSPKIPTSLTRNLSESFVSESSDSSFDSLPDSEVLKIQELTKAIDSKIRSKLSHYKRTSTNYSQKYSSLQQKVKIYENEFTKVEKGYTDLLKQTKKNQKYAEKIQNFVRQNSKIHTDENFTCLSTDDQSALEMVKKLKEDVIKIRETMDKSDSEKLEASKSRDNFPVKPVQFDRPKDKFCSCQVF